MMLIIKVLAKICIKTPQDPGEFNEDFEQVELEKKYRIADNNLARSSIIARSTTMNLSKNSMRNFSEDLLEYLLCDCVLVSAEFWTLFISQLLRCIKKPTIYTMVN